MSIIVQLAGGLGNQMFQYAAARAVSHRLQLPLKLDISRLQKSKTRTYQLHHFSIIEDFATEKDLQMYSSIEEKSGLIISAIKKVKHHLLPWYKQSVIEQRGYHYHEDFHRIKKSCYLKGYWQSENYFKMIEHLIRDDFRIKKETDAQNRELINQISGTESVSVHIRRGDYVENPVTKKNHGILGLTYYERAAEYISKKVDNPAFFIFSDDTEWVKQHFRPTFLYTVINHNRAEDVHEDLRLMSCCKHHIIANSTFSWWGAWLSGNENKQITAPVNWFTDQVMKSRGELYIIPESWKQL